MDNLIATMLGSGNRYDSLADSGLDRIASHQGFDRAEFSARYAHLDAEFERQLSTASLQPSNKFEIPEGK